MLNQRHSAICERSYEANVANNGKLRAHNKQKKMNKSNHLVHQQESTLNESTPKRLKISQLHHFLYMTPVCEKDFC